MKRWRLIAITAATVAVAGLASRLFESDVTFPQDGSGARKLGTRLTEMAMLALVIERAVEVYLRAFSLNGPDRHKPEAVESGKLSAGQYATILALSAGILAALLGARIFNSFLILNSDNDWAQGLWAGLDIAISGGLLAGGAVFMHEIVETLVGGVRTINAKVSPASEAFAGGPVSVQATVTTTLMNYTITVTRETVNSGKLQFTNGTVTVNTTCWWDPQNKIAAGTYAGCSKTRMTTKTDSVTNEPRPGIFLPTAVSPATGSNSIFIHEGTGPGWSDGCIVLKRDEMMRMWDSITPSDGRNVTVIVNG